MVRRLIRYLNKAGMSPEAIRERKPYIVLFVQDVRVTRRRPQPIGSSALRRPADVALPAGFPIDLSQANGTLRPARASKTFPLGPRFLC
jgi:hypothetical protein